MKKGGIELIAYIITGAILQLLLLVINEELNYGYEKKTLSFVCSILLAAIVGLKYNTQNLELFSISNINPYGLLVLVLGICLINLTFIDFKYLEIPDTYNIFVLLLGVANMIYHKNQYFLIIGFISFILFFIISKVSSGALGGGDVKLSFGLGLFFTLPNYGRFLMFTFGTGALAALLLIIFKIKEKKDKMAFGPFIALGAVLSLLI